MPDEARYPTSMPKISSIALLLTNIEKIRSIPNTTAEPISAPTSAPTYCPAPNPSRLPHPSITTATPSDAPVDTPMIDGPARGLAKVVCRSSPATARDAPAASAVSAIGRRTAQTIASTMESSGAVRPQSVRHTAEAGMSTVPIKSSAKRRTTTVSPHTANFHPDIIRGTT